MTAVLVFEDEKLMSWTLVSSLVKWGYDARPAFNGHEAIEELGRSGFDARYLKKVILRTLICPERTAALLPVTARVTFLRGELRWGTLSPVDVAYCNLFPKGRPTCGKGCLK